MRYDLAISSIATVSPDLYWSASWLELAIEAIEGVGIESPIEAMFCADGIPGNTCDRGTLLADRLGLDVPTFTFRGGDVADAMAVQAACHYASRLDGGEVIVVSASKISDLDERQRMSVSDLLLDPEAERAYDLTFYAQAGLLAGHFISVAGSDDCLRRITARNLAAWHRSSHQRVLSEDELKHDIIVAQPLCRSDFPRLLDGAAALRISSGHSGGRGICSIGALSSAVDILNPWDRRDPSRLLAAEKALARLRGDARHPCEHFEIDAMSVITQALVEREIELHCSVTGIGPTICAAGGNFGRGRPFGSSSIYLFEDACRRERATPWQHIAVSGLGAQAFAFAMEPMV